VPYDSIVGHAGPIARLKALAQRERVAGAYLFAGPAGLGKRAVARAFFEGMGAEVQVLERAEDKREILMEQVRELLRTLSFRPRTVAPRGVLIDDAERLNLEGQNALLKTLEEPPERTTFVLVTASPALLLPTIVSRCHTVIFTPLSDADMRRILEPMRLDAETAEWIAALAQGSPGRAHQVAAEAEDLRARTKELFDGLAAGTFNQLVEHLSRVRDQEEARRRAREILELTILALREELRSRETDAPPRPAILPQALRLRLLPLEPEDLADRIRNLMDHARFIDANANVALTVEDALLRI
jgi:DNA polymerase-3 subunit delta'